ncbi:hypothetical protein K4K54_008874 [Colletotrichum sp. SAR 10_86]|nr:hypothetical protein K4K51_003844 [Colletotrichum sp. SAR 10_75]KAI8185868.1 hypothetical protein KHU50_001556 [Colletotrichum sp. SAR 10_65]KAI8217753.1 hypothetical protein K4K53_009017 [Colletotrichum sp. SAR 10_77]KAI8220138.1 hypothetical protein K4K54_008874 [Colletotrichum sp. SAR 10_86]
MATAIHVVSKKDLAHHRVVPVNISLPSLAPSRSSLIAITSNNLNNAKLGDFVHWWSTWPIPADTPVPYNNDEWGIVPAWGFGRALESNVETHPAGSLLYGFWPTSFHTVDLKLSNDKGRFRGVSKHRPVSYDGLAAEETVAWIGKFKPKRVVVLDHGAPLATTERFVEALSEALSETQTTLVMIGVEPKMGTADELVSLLGSKRQSRSTVELNTTFFIDIGIATEGGQKVFEENKKTFNRAVEEKNLGDIELVKGSGVSGSGGVEGAWENLIQGTLAPNKVWVYRLDGKSQ